MEIKTWKTGTKIGKLFTKNIYCIYYETNGTNIIYS